MKSLLLTLLLCLFPAAVSAQPSKAVPLKLKDINGRAFSLSDYRGNVVLLNFWATWCPPCRAEIPDLMKLQRQYHKQGLRIIGITYPPQTLSEVRIFTKKLRVNYRIAIGTKQTKTLFTPAGTLPMTIVIDREGVVRDVIEGILFADEFEEKVQPLLKTTQPTRPDESTKRQWAIFSPTTSITKCSLTQYCDALVRRTL